jgi:hypothetical protein
MMSNLVPETWPDYPGETPMRTWPARWWNWPVWFVLLVLLPQRAGAALRSGSKRLALLVYALTIPVGLAATVVIAAWDNLQDLGDDWLRATNWSEAVRLPFVLVVEGLYEKAGDVDFAVLLAVLTGGAVAGPWLFAWLLMPLVAIGQRAGRTYAQALRVVLWGGAGMLATMPLVAWLYAQLRSDNARWLHDISQDPQLPLAAAIFLALLFWFNRIRRMAMPPIGDPAAPVQELATPRCIDCGYMLAMQPEDSRCPECGTAVADSLPAARQPTAWAQKSRHALPLRTFLNTGWALVYAPRAFFRSLPVYQERRAAARFAAWCATALGLWVALHIFLATTQGPDDLPGLVGELIALSFGAGVALGFPLLLLIGSFVLGVFGWRDFRRPAVSVGYTAVHWALTLAWVPIFAWLVAGYTEHEWYDTLEPIRFLPEQWWNLILILVGLSPGMALLAHAIYCLRQALKQTRHASA